METSLPNRQSARAKPSWLAKREKRGVGAAGPFALIGVAALGAAVAVHLSKLSSRAKNGQGVGVTMA